MSTYKVKETVKRVKKSIKKAIKNIKEKKACVPVNTLLNEEILDILEQTVATIKASPKANYTYVGGLVENSEGGTIAVLGRISEETALLINILSSMEKRVPGVLGIVVAAVLARTAGSGD